MLTGAGHGFCSEPISRTPSMPNIDGLTVTLVARRAMQLSPT